MNVSLAKPCTVATHTWRVVNEKNQIVAKVLTKQIGPVHRGDEYVAVTLDCALTQDGAIDLPYNFGAMH